MKINRLTNLESLSALMGTDTTRDESENFRDLLINRGIDDSDKVTDREWSALIAESLTA